MIQEKYIRDNSNNYMMISSPEKPGEESYQIKMLLKNTVSKFLPISLKSINNNQMYCYDISSKQPLSRMYEGNNITNDDVINIAMHISQITSIVNEYLLELDSVVLNARLMYMNISDRSLYFTYYPYGEKEFGESLRQLFEFILEHLDHSDKKAVMLTYGIYQKILQNDYNVENLLENVIEDQKNERPNIKDCFDSQEMDCHNNSSSENKENRRVIECVLPEVIEDEVEVRNLKIHYIFIAVKATLVILLIFTLFNILLPKYRVIKIGLVPAAIIIIFNIAVYKLLDIIYSKNKMYFTKLMKKGETIGYSVPAQKVEVTERNNHKEITDKLNVEIQEEYVCTQLLSDYLKETTSSVSCRLVAQDDISNEKEISIKENPFIIGSYATKCNYTLNNKLISRMHIRISKEKSSKEYFVEDLNSTNGTYVNGEKIEPNQKVQMKDKDILKIAVMQFRLEID